jgi:phosphatidylglycerophosphate synthase
MSYHPKYCTWAYVVSCLLDAVDGQAARALQQTSKIGAVLDMVTDRCVFAIALVQIVADARGTAARRHACCVIWLLLIQPTRFFSSSSLHWTLAVTTCTCIGSLPRSLVRLHP